MEKTEDQYFTDAESISFIVGIYYDWLYED